MFNSNQALLLVIDIQTRLAEKVQDSEAVIQNSLRLIKAAKILEMPILVTEQAPEKIGTTAALLTKELTNIQKISKKSFSCCGEPKFKEALKKLKRQQIIITGMETHVCVYQTVAQLLEQSYQAQVVVDAVSSRNLTDKQAALNRIEKMGCPLTTTEMMITELLKTAEHPRFKEVFSLIK